MMEGKNNALCLSRGTCLFIKTVCCLLTNTENHLDKDILTFQDQSAISKQVAFFLNIYVQRIQPCHTVSKKESACVF